MSHTHPEHLRQLEKRQREHDLFAVRLKNANIYLPVLSFHHIRPDHNYRGMTIAYRERSKSLIDISVATLHPNDTFSKQMGRIVATEHMVQGKYITIRNPMGWSIPRFLEYTFKYAALKPIR